MSGGSERVVVVYNPRLRNLTTLTKYLRSEADKAPGTELVMVPAEPGLEQALAQAVRRASSVIVLGGDGLVRAAATQLIGTGIPLGVVPSGTGNLLARNLHLPLAETRKAMRIAWSGTPHLIDAGRATVHGVGFDETHVFTVMTGVGLDAAMAAEANFVQKKRFGWLAYVAPIVRSIVRNNQHHMELKLDDRKPVSLKAHTAIVGNCGTLTANLLLLPDAQLTDGKLDVVVLNPKAITGWTRIWSRVALSGALVRSRPGRVLLRAAPPMSAVQYGQFRRLEIKFAHAQPVQIDGDVVGDASSVEVEVLPASLVVRVART